MKSRVVRVAAVALLLSGVAILPVRADDEVKTPVPARANANDPNTAVYRVSEVIGLPVKDDDGAEVGRIKDLVVNGESREVLYAVVAMNDGKEKDALYVMPWTVFRPYYGQNAIQYTVLQVPQSVWVQAPFFTSTQWRTATFAQWAPRVNTYYARHIPQNAVGGSQGVRVNKPATDDDPETKNPNTKPAPNAPKNPAAPGVKPENPPKSPAPKPTDPKTPEAPGVKPENPPKSPAPKPTDPKTPEVPGVKPETPPKSPLPKPSNPTVPNDPTAPKTPKPTPNPK